MGWILWFIGVVIAVIVGLHALAGIDVPFVVDQAAKLGVEKTLLAACGNGKGSIAASQF
jgi:hypothetical protein